MQCHRGLKNHSQNTKTYNSFTTADPQIIIFSANSSPWRGAVALCIGFPWPGFGSGEGGEGEQDGMIQLATGQGQPHL